MFFYKKKRKACFLVVGLGNPGKKYLRTRHNIGFVAADYAAKCLGTKMSRVRFSALTGEVGIEGKSVLLIKPQTYMNRSGASVAQAAAYFDIPPECVVVLCDDVALDPGTLRIRRSGSSGGHNGLRSVEEHLGSSDYVRIRIGVGEKRGEALFEHVLSEPTKGERERIYARFPDILEALTLIVKGDILEAQNRFNAPQTV